MIEIEKTYLVKYLPDGLENCQSKEIFDIYLPNESRHPAIRIRKSGNKYELTKKSMVDPNDASHLLEENIPLEQTEFDCLKDVPNGLKLRKIRYLYDYQGHTAEIDVFQDGLKGLILADFEFSAKDVKDEHKLPDFCLADVTQEEFIAGGKLCGKKYEDIEKDLERFGYKKLI